MKERMVTVRHTQGNGHDYIKIHAPSGLEYLVGKWPIQGDPFESAVDSIWDGFLEARKVSREVFGAVPIAVYSTTEGALEMFESQMVPVPKEDADE